MKNLFGKSNPVYNGGRKITELEAGQVFFHGAHTFVKLENPIPNKIECSDCGKAHDNAHNFSSAVHFCDNRFYPLRLTEFCIETPLES